MPREARIPVLGFAAAVMALAPGAITELRSQGLEPCLAPDEQARVRVLALAAIDDSFKLHVGNLFVVWMRDYSPEPERATAGMSRGISAYRRARANAQQWSMPTC
jgi:hypothetical protein